MQLILLVGIFVILVIILLKSIRSNVLSLFQHSFPHFNAGRLKLTTIDTTKPSAPAHTAVHTFRKSVSSDTPSVITQLQPVENSIEIMQQFAERANMIGILIPAHNTNPLNKR